MENFIDYILFLLLIFFIAFTGLLLFLLIKNPTAGYMLIVGFLTGLLAIGGILIWKVFQKKRLGDYYDDFQEILQIRKEIYLSTKGLERPVKKLVTAQFPQINQLCRETQRCLQKVAEIDKVIVTFEKKHHTVFRQSPLDTPGHSLKDAKINESTRRYQENLYAIKLSKSQHLKQVQRILQLFQELNSQILAMKYSQEKPELQTEIIESINEMLYEIHKLNENP